MAKTSKTEQNTISVRMRRVRSTYIALVCALVSGCSHEGILPETDTSAKVEMALNNQPSTRAHFEDTGGTASFVWDADNSMIAVVSKNGAIAQWSTEQWYSAMNISLVDPENTHHVLKASSALTLSTDAVATGDKMFCLSPVNGSPLCQSTASSSTVEVSFSMPSTFEQSASSRLEEFGDYCYIRGESTIKSTPSASDKNFAANSTTFRAIPATFRFNVTNNTDSDIKMESVKITCNNLFPDNLCWKTDGASVSISEPDDKSGYFSTIKTSVRDGYGETIKAREETKTHTGTYYSMCLPFDNESSLSDATLAFILEASDKIYTFNITAEEFFKSSAVRKFESNKIYTFTFKMSEESVELEDVTVSDWVTDPFYLPTEEISAYIHLNISYWVQDRENLYTYAFMRMVEDSSTYTMWGKCNIGEFMNSATDVRLMWTEVTPANSSNTDYLARFFSNITDFKWQTPSRADFRALFDSANTDVEMHFDQESQIYGLLVKRKDDEEVSIFLPCSEKAKDETYYPSDGVTHNVRTLQGNYWTLDGEDDTYAWLMHFEFQYEETEEGDTVTSSSFNKVLDSGNSIYEFRKEPKSKSYPVRAILRNE